MARIAIDAALGSGFGLIRRQPGAVLLWGLVYLAVGAASWGVLGSYNLAFLSHLAANARLGTAALMQAENDMMPRMIAMQGWTWLVNFIFLFVGMVLYCAVFRAILHPEQKRFGYLRLGATELLLFVLCIGFYIVFMVAVIILALILVVLIAALFAMHAAAAGIVMGALAAIVTVIVVVWIALRFSMVGPMMVADSKFHLFESWTLTKGHAGILFVMAVCLMAILLVAELVVFGALMVAGAAALAPAVGGMVNLPSFFERSPSAVAAALAPVLIVAAVILPPLWGCGLAIVGAPWARIYLDLTEPAPAAVAA
ncbi:MAG: hypothetical protein ACR2FH_05255 [Caulobacteraceae bacterium]